MPAREIDAWFASHKPCTIDGLRLKPRPFPSVPNMPLSVIRGQAEAFYLKASGDGNHWILKKFHSGKEPDRGYLNGIRQCLPQTPGFTSGSRRRIISGPDSASAYAPKPLTKWLDGTVLMPKIEGFDWAKIADDLRTGSLTLKPEERGLLCRGLAQAISELENAGCAHRDLSSGNVYIDGRTWQVSLIDWDSLYHSCLTMPPNTTAGTQGYIAPFVWRNRNIDASKTWAPLADRFALAACCAEFLTMNPGSSLQGEGGLFAQDDLRRRSGPTVDVVQRILRTRFLEAANLFERAIQADSYTSCPSPAEWMQFSTLLVGDGIKIDPLPPGPTVDEFESLLARQTPPPPVWPAPLLPPAPGDGISAILARASIVNASIHPVPPLPADPWDTRTR